MKVALAVLADYANVTREGKLNVMGLFNIVAAPTLPARHGSMNLVMRFSAQPSEFGRTQQIHITLADEDGQKLLDLAADIVPQGPPGEEVQLDQILNLNNLTFPKYGTYTFDILVNNNFDTRVALKVVPMSTGGLGPGPAAS